MISNEQIKYFSQFISSYDAFIIAGHKEPDGDCIASCIAVSSLLQQQQKRVQMISAGPFKRAEIKSYEKLFKKEPENGLWFNPPLKQNQKQALIYIDCSTPDRLGDVEPFVKDLPFFVIDHHKTSSCDKKISIIDTAAPATAYIVQQLYEKIAGSLNNDIAEILFFGLATDTGFFRHLNQQSSHIFEAASRLVAGGANPRETFANMTGGKSFLSRKLLGTALDNAEQYFDGKLILTYETLEETERYALEGRDSDSLYQLLLAVKNVEAVVFVRQESEENCTVGFRSKDLVDVSAVAAKLGGGGHKNAAGLTIKTTIKELMPILLQEFSKIL